MDIAALVRMIVGLALVIGAILLSAWLARRFGLAGASGRRAADLRLQATLALGPRHRMAIVRVEDARLVVGIGPQGVTLLHTLPPASPQEEEGQEPAAAAHPASSTSTSAPAATFQALLAQWRPASTNNRNPTRNP